MRLLTSEICTTPRTLAVQRFLPLLRVQPKGLAEPHSVCPCDGFRMPAHHCH